MSSPRRSHLRNRFTLLAAVAAVAAGLSACGGTTEVATPAKDVIPASIAAVSTDTLRGAVGAQVSLPLAVIVKNKAGEALDTVLVTYTVESGNGTLSGPTARTNATGQASVTWTLGSSVGLQTVTATIGALTPVTFRAVATVGTPATMTKVTGDNQTVTINTNVPVAPSVKIVDRFGNPISGTLVSFAVGSGGGSVNGGAVNTDANGVATVTSWRLGGTIGANTLVVTGGGLTATFTATASVGAPATLVLTPATVGELSLGQTQQLTARVSDAAGNVIPNATVTYATTNAAVAAVSTSGLITASGAGTANVSATAGTASASVAITVIGHPLGTTVTDSLDLGAVAPGDIAFTQDKMFVGLNGQQSILVMDGAGRTTLGTIPVTSPIPILLAPPKATGPVVAINPATLSRLWFVNPGTATVVDSLDIPNVIQTAAMTSDGTRVYAMLDNGNLAVVNATTHALQTLITLGGGVSKIRIAPGDSLLYATTNVGVIFEVDTRSNTIRRQIIANVASTDFAIAKDGLFYLLDGIGNLVRLVDINTGQVVRAFGVTPNATTIALSPDNAQVWLTHVNPLLVTIYSGDKTNGFRSAGSFPTGVTLPIRVYFSPSGSFAAVTNFGGFIQIVR